MGTRSTWALILITFNLFLGHTWRRFRAYRILYPGPTSQNAYQRWALNGGQDRNNPNRQQVVPYGNGLEQLGGVGRGVGRVGGRGRRRDVRGNGRGGGRRGGGVVNLNYYYY